MPLLSRSVLPTFSTDHDCYPGGSPRLAPAVWRWCALLLAIAVLLCAGAGLFGAASALAATPAHPVPASPKATHAAEPAHIRLVASSTPLRPVRRTAPAAAGAAHTAAPASGSVWDQVARCESGGRWNISTGNGYSGGLQFTPSTWRAYGGTQYASSASHATREQQIAIAEKVLAGQGPGAWPVCSKKAGLTRGHTRALGTSEQGCHTSQHGHVEQCNWIEPAEHAHAHARHKSDSHRGQHSTHRGGGGDAGAHDGGAANSGTIVVQPGDTLSSLATAHHVSGGWHQLYHANRTQLGGNPNALHTGQRLTLPSA